MNLQGRTLTLNMWGEDVRLLHHHLRQLGYTIVDDEVREVVFGASTYQAVVEFRRQRGLPLSGEVDEAVAKLMKSQNRRLMKSFQSSGQTHRSQLI